VEIVIESNRRVNRVAGFHAYDLIERSGLGFRRRSGGNFEDANCRDAPALSNDYLVTGANLAGALGYGAIDADRARIAQLLGKGAARDKPRNFEEDVKPHGRWQESGVGDQGRVLESRISDMKSRIHKP
jgi:hypothetical protein